MIKIDLNSDVGERPEAIKTGIEEKIIGLISSANIACGGHAGDDLSMKKTIMLCKKYGVKIGAHPSFPDKENFGRIEMSFTEKEIENFVYDQVLKLVKLSEKYDVDVRHVKPHGALYNSAAKNFLIARAIGDGVKRVDRKLLLVGLAGSKMLDVWNDMGFVVISEAFADRRYEPDGSLRSRKFSDSLITNPLEAALQALSISRENKVCTITGQQINIFANTICIHSDTLNSLEILTSIHTLFAQEGIKIEGF